MLNLEVMFTGKWSASLWDVIVLHSPQVADLFSTGMSITTSQRVSIQKTI